MSNTFIDVTLSGAIAPGVELMNAIALNGQIYDKIKYVPKEFSFFPSKSYANEFFANSMLFLHNFSGQTDSAVIYNNLFIDTKDPSVSYYIYQSPRASGPAPQLVKATSTNSSFNFKVEEFPLGADTVNASIQYIDQDSTNIYFLSTHKTPKIIKFDKNKKTSVSLSFPNGVSTTKVLMKNINFIYLVTQSQDTANTIIFYKFDKSTFTIKKIQTFSSADLNGHSTNVTTKFTDLKNNYTYTTCQRTIDSVSYFYLRWFNCDFSIDKITTDYMEINHGTFTKEGFQQLDFPITMTYELDLIEDPSGTYLQATRYIATNSLRYTEVKFSKQFTYSLVTEKKCNLINIEQMPTWYYGKLNFNENKSQVLIHDGGIEIYAWDYLNKKMRSTHSYSCKPYQVAIDKLNNIYVVDLTGVIFRDSRTRPAGEIRTTIVDKILNTDFINPKSNRLKIEVTNYIGEYLNSTVLVTLYGNAKFSDNNDTIKIVTTTPEGPSYEDILITGQGEISAVAVPYK